MVNRSGIKVCDVLMLDATRNFDWIGFEGSGEVKGQRSVHCFGENGKFLHCIFERNCAVKTWEISEMDFEMNCCETRTGKCT